MACTTLEDGIRNVMMMAAAWEGPLQIALAARGAWCVERRRPPPPLESKEQPEGVSSPASPAALDAEAACTVHLVSARCIHGAAVHPRW